MLRNRLFKRFGNGGVDDIPKKGISTSTVTPTSPQVEEITNEGNLNIPTAEELNAVLQKDFAQRNSNTLGKPFAPKGSYRSSLMPEGTITSEGTTYEPGTFNDASKTLNFLYSNTGTKANEGQSKPEENQDNQTRDAISLGLLGLDAALGYNQDLKNSRRFNESIQQRDSEPLYDYNYMYGRTTSGGTEFQPTIKAEMGAQINKRYSSGGENNVEIEGGEFIQLPNFETEMATGPSHSNGGIPTNLPDQTRVYSNSLKPEGSKKTFAQMAKNYDITSYKKTLDNPFAKQVDKDTAGIMMQRNQKILDSLFNDQQALNGDSNGEMEAKNGANINNAGFKALPQSVQDKILAEMQYGGNVQEAQTLQMDDGGKKNPQPDITTLPPELRQYAKWDPTFKKEDGTLGVYRLEVPSNLDFDAKTNIARAAETYGITNLVQTSNQRITGSPNVKGFYAGLSPQDFEQKIVRENLGKEEAGKLNELDTRKKAFEILGVDPGSYDINDPTKLYNDDYFRESVFYPKFQKYLPEGQFRPKKGNDKAFGFEHLDAKPKPKTPPLTPEGSSGTPPDGTKIDDVTPGKTGKYTPGNFPLYQAIPEAMGLAQSQEIYPYAIPEIDAPYVRPQTLNIQSELQDIDNMGTAAIRGGADPNMAYIAGLDAKQKAFQTKQNYDAEGRSRADMANAQMSFQADQFNAGAFDKVYNNLVGQARDAQSAEKQAAVANLVTKKAKFEQDENLKALGIPIVSPTFNWNSTGNPTMPEGMRAAFEMYNYMKEQDAKKAAEKPKAKKGMYKKSKY
jgi:hypothetical protein